MSLHCGERLPDGRDVLVNHRVEPATSIIRRIHKAKMAAKPPNPEDYAELAAWLDGHPDQLCTHASIRAGCHQGEAC